MTIIDLKCNLVQIILGSPTKNNKDRSDRYLRAHSFLLPTLTNIWNNNRIIQIKNKDKTHNPHNHLVFIRNK